MAPQWILEHVFEGEIPPGVSLTPTYFTGEICDGFEGVVTNNKRMAERYQSIESAQAIATTLKTTPPNWPNVRGKWVVREIH
jgi:hypothetical protein